MCTDAEFEAEAPSWQGFKLLGQRVKMRWELDAEWFTGMVFDFEPETGKGHSSFFHPE